MAALHSLPPWPIHRRMRTLAGSLAWLAMLVFCLAAWYGIILVILEAAR